jgi:hypothetical protein
MEHIPMTPNATHPGVTNGTTRHDTHEEPGEEEFARRYPPGHRIHKEIGAAIDRWFSNAYAFWRLCERRACRRAQCCKGDPSHCVETFGPLLPDDVHDGAIAVFEGKTEGLSFEAVVQRYPEQLAAWADWKTRLENRAGAPRPRVRPAAAGRE